MKKRNIISKIAKVLFYIRYHRKFIKLHINSIVVKPLIITPHFLSFGKHVSIYKNCRIQGISKYNDKIFSPVIIFDDYSSSQQNLHLTCAKKIYIGKNTAIAANVTITDIHHPYEDIFTPIERQDIVVREVYIGDDCKIYNNAVILPGTRIGKHCTVGANSVVGGKFPDYCVIAGIPAKIIKKYNFETKTWEKV